jgi:aminopeptidase N
MHQTSNDQNHRRHRRHHLGWLGILAGLTLTAASAELQGAGSGSSELAGRQDIHSYARPQEAAVEHLALDVSVDFGRQELVGQARLDIVNHGGADTLWLDTNGLAVEGITVDGAPTNWRLGDPDPLLGRPLAVSIKPDSQSVTVRYRTVPGAEGLQWLEPAQTAGGKSPFLFTQSQAIYARTWVPCQDTPGVRFTYEATIRVPPDLMAVMSAENPTAKSVDGVYHFSMQQRIPSYLLALAVGDLAYRPLDERTAVFAEPSVLAAAAAEFVDLPAMVDTAEVLYGPYRWGRYDVLVLPPSFPFGGMENPRLTFATPTILAGDRSLVSLIAHELAHSWSGNLVTNATWNDFWLNEGFTTYIERRIVEALYGRDFAEMQASLALGDLRNTLADLGTDSRDTWLRLDLAGRNPDDGVSDIAYEKGYAFLRLLEESVGRDAFDPFVRAWFDEHAFQSVTTDDFLTFLNARLLRANPALAAKVRVSEWVDGPGLPSNLPVPSAERFSRIDAAAKAWAAGTPAAKLTTAGWSSPEWVHFIRRLPAGLTATQMADLDTAFGFSKSGNSENLFAWLLQVVANHYQPGYAALDHFLTTIGRRKFVQPLFVALVADPELLPMARTIYAKARPGYHAVTRMGVDALLAKHPVASP